LRRPARRSTRGTKAIYEATFSYDDVLREGRHHRPNRGCWDLYEVKSSTSVKEHHWTTSLCSYYVLSGCGLPINKAYLVHINNGYVRDGDVVPEELFVLQDISRIVKEKQASLPDTLSEMRVMLRGKVPKIDIGPTARTRTRATSWRTAGGTCPSIPSSPCGA